MKIVDKSLENMENFRQLATTLGKTKLRVWSTAHKFRECLPPFHPEYAVFPFAVYIFKDYVYRILTPLFYMGVKLGLYN
jgi:hypothetical protein